MVTFSEIFLIGDTITQALNLPIGFSGEFILIGLKNNNTGELIEFEREEGTRTTFLLDTSPLEKETEYEVIYEGIFPDSHLLVVSFVLLRDWSNLIRNICI